MAWRPYTALSSRHTSRHELFGKAPGKSAENYTLHLILYPRLLHQNHDQNMTKKQQNFLISPLSVLRQNSSRVPIRLWMWIPRNMDTIKISALSRTSSFLSGIRSALFSICCVQQARRFIWGLKRNYFLYFLFWERNMLLHTSARMSDFDQIAQGTRNPTHRTAMEYEQNRLDRTSRHGRRRNDGHSIASKKEGFRKSKQARPGRRWDGTSMLPLILCRQVSFCFS